MNKTTSMWQIPGTGGILVPGRWFWPRAVTWTALLFALSIEAFFACYQLPDSFRILKPLRMLIALTLPVATLVVYALAVRFVERRSVTELALSRAPMELILGFVAGFVFITGTLLLLWAAGLYDVQRGTWRHVWGYFVYNSYISAVLEELAFRAILLRLFARMFGPLPALILSSAAFGLAHASHAPLAAVLEICLNSGMVLGLLYLVSGRLWLAVGAHLSIDFTEWSLMGVGDHDGLLQATPVPGHSAWLTGGNFGPDGSLLSSLVGVVLIVAILALKRMSNKRSKPADRLVSAR
jgi:membrane protease YdiL (CAAX protease family)